MTLPDYTDLDIVKNRIAGEGLELSDNWDEGLEGKCSEVSRDIDRMVGQARGDATFKFVADDQASTRTFRGRGAAYLPIADAIEISSVAIRAIPAGSSTELASTDWIAAPSWSTPIVGIERVGGIFPASCLVDVGAKWGYAAELPLDVQKAATVEVIRSYLGDRAGNDDRLGLSPFGTVMVAKAFTSLLNRLVADYGYGGASMRG